ncbi:serine/threonine-protein kinase VRK1 [Anabrus simplex]|uniref:serine/threonine-protein kinase VRK1 n=1 Tax=Anabrus simplex TaxID=316456 RepID=UPI0035A2FC73
MSPRKVVSPKSVRVSPRRAAHANPKGTTRPSPKKVAPKKRGGAKNKFPEAIPSGETLIDLRKNKWIVGSPIGKGGFGAIYSASEASVPGKDVYAVKIEPKENGPLFVEMHFMMKVCQPNDIAAWQKMKKLSHLGIPRFIASGSHNYNERNYRFVIMDRFGRDLWGLFLDNKKSFPLSTVLQIGLQILDALEYIHSKGYVHADIKGSNLMLGLTKGSENCVYLLDFGLATKYTTKEYKYDPKTAHNGTIEYCSRDAHDGVPTRRGDLEILAYNMLHWVASKLPWEKHVPDNKLVQEEKVRYMADIPALLQWCFGKQTPPVALRTYIKYVAGMAYNEEPNYEYCRGVFREGLKGKSVGKLDFKQEKTLNNFENCAEEESPKRHSGSSNDKLAVKKKLKK